MVLRQKKKTKNKMEVDMAYTYYFDEYFQHEFRLKTFFFLIKKGLLWLQTLYSCLLKW